MASIQQNNIELHTVYTSSSLTLISVTPFWAVSLKLSRYVKWDPGDICLLLRLVNYLFLVVFGFYHAVFQLQLWIR